MTSVPRLGDIPRRLAVDEFWRLFGRLEHEQLDFKHGVPKDVRDTIAAMAMTHGGLIVHGVDDRRNIVGCPLSQNTQDRITRIASECGVDIQIREVAVGERTLTICAVPEVRERIVTTPDGRLLRRVGGDAQPLRGDAMARFVREREHRAGEDEPLVVVQASAFDLGAINQALAADGRPAVRRNRVDRALADLGVAVAAPPPLEPNVLCAAAVLFANDPRDFIRGAAVQLVRRSGIGPGPGPSAAREECSGPFGETVDCCLRFIGRHTRRFEVVAGVRREGLPEYPEAALREAVVNALAHRDYGLDGATVDVTVWDDRIEVRSPGPLPGHITIDNMREEHYSRNPRIMRVLKTTGLVEEYGEGIDRMYREMESRLMEPPIFEATSSSVTVTLRNRFLVDVEDQVWLALLGRDDLTAHERRVLVAVRRNGAITPRELRDVLPDADAGALLAGAVAKGLLARVGRRGGSRYVLSEETTLRAGSAGMAAQSHRRRMLHDEIRRRGSISVAEGTRLIDAPPAVVRGLLNELVRAGVVRAEGRTRARRYHPKFDDSLPASRLQVDVKPDDWSRSVRSVRTSGLTEAQQAYQRFWGEFLPAFRDEHPGWTRAVSPRKKHWMLFPSARSSLLKYSVAFCRPAGRYRLRGEAYIDAGDKETTKETFDKLHDRKQKIERAVGEELEWDRMDDKRGSRVSLYFPGEVRITDEDRWPEARDWLVQAMGKMRTAFDPVIQEL